MNGIHKFLVTYAAAAGDTVRKAYLPTAFNQSNKFDLSSAGAGAGGRSSAESSGPFVSFPDSGAGCTGSAAALSPQFSTLPKFCFMKPSENRESSGGCDCGAGCSEVK